MELPALTVPWQSGPKLSGTPPSPLYYPGCHGNRSSSRLREAKPHGKRARFHISSRTPVCRGIKKAKSVTHHHVNTGSLWNIGCVHFTALPASDCELEARLSDCKIINNGGFNTLPPPPYCKISTCSFFNGPEAYVLQLWPGCASGWCILRPGALNKWRREEQTQSGRCPDRWCPDPPPHRSCSLSPAETEQ